MKILVEIDRRALLKTFVAIIRPPKAVSATTDGGRAAPRAGRYSSSETALASAPAAGRTRPRSVRARRAQRVGVLAGLDQQPAEERRADQAVGSARRWRGRRATVSRSPRNGCTTSRRSYQLSRERSATGSRQRPLHVRHPAAHRLDRFQGGSGLGTRGSRGVGQGFDARHARLAPGKDPLAAGASSTPRPVPIMLIGFMIKRADGGFQGVRKDTSSAGIVASGPGGRTASRAILVRLRRLVGGLAGSLRRRAGPAGGGWGRPAGLDRGAPGVARGRARRCGRSRRRMRVCAGPRQPVS